MDSKINHKLISPGKWEVVIQKGLDEEVAYPEIPQNLEQMLVDLSQVSFINSSGIRNWIRWMGTASISLPYKRVQISGVPLTFIRAANLVAEVLPEPVVVSSFFVNYYCEKCEEDRKILVENKGKLQLADRLCEVCNQAMELELSEKSYDCVLNRREERT